MKCYRRIIGKTRRDKIREGLKQKSVDKMQLKWFGHVVRMENRKKPRQIMEARTEGRRGRGKPTKPYMEKIEDTARKTGKEIGEMKGVARNREDWRTWIEAAIVDLGFTTL